MECGYQDAGRAERGDSPDHPPGIYFGVGIPILKSTERQLWGEKEWISQSIKWLCEFILTKESAPGNDGNLS